MRRVVIPDNGEDSNAITRWVADRIGESVDRMRSPYGIGVVDDGKIEMGMVLCDYTGNNLMIHFAKNAGVMIAPQVYGDLLKVPFSKPISVGRVSGFANESNGASIDLMKMLGFKQEGCIRKHFGNEDALVFGLLKEEFEESRYGK